MATKTAHHPAGFLARLAHWLGRTWARGWNKAGAALASAGLPPKAVAALTWVAKLAIVAVLLYVAFWVVMLVVFVILVMNMGAHRGGGGNAGYTVPEDDEPSYKWMAGPEGYGLYDSLGFLVGEPDKDEDRNWY